MNEMSVLRKRANQKLQTEMEFKSKLKICKLYLLFRPARYDQRFLETSQPTSLEL